MIDSLAHNLLADAAVVRHPLQATITVVSGLPRSGTSLMMQILHAGGMRVLTDALRPPDESNPLGYFELQAVKQTRNDSTWTNLADGCAVKVIYRLLRDLPPIHKYQVLFMRRDLDEVVLSQYVMLNRSTTSALDRQRLVGIFRRELLEVDDWLKSATHMRVLNISHDALIARPQSIIPDLCMFLGKPLDQAAMIAAIKPSLYRNRCLGEQA